MKTIKRRVLVVVFMLGTLFNYANNDKEFNKTVGAKKVKVVFKDVKKGQLLSVNDKNGFQFHSETVSSQGELIKFFDLSPLNNGVYTIELNKEFKVVIKSLLVKNNNVSFIKDSEKIIFKPVIRNKENLVLISKVNFDKKPVQITLLYNDEVIYSETLKGELMLKRVYRLDKELKGEYKVIVYCDDESYSNEFKI
ncbi:MAG: hypothetical protein ACI9Z4_000836 [Polaribacter sp.]|jgi:hypothetical protein